MSQLNASVQWIQKLEFQQFSIPDYQRPYVWGIKETRQLWDDILQSKTLAKKDYRIGTIILHENEEKKTLDIVDGQQRLTTLALLMYILAQKDNADLNCLSFLEKKQFLHQVSADNIKINADEIQQWVHDEISEDDEDLLSYILTHCSVTVLAVSEISAAFQIFDSQNGRGLPLQAYNLLKAYHMRFFENEDVADKIQYDKTWEEAAKNSNHIDYLQQVIHEQLYRSRIWSRNSAAYSFSRKQIKEFKGSSKQQMRYPYENYVFSTNTDENKFVTRYKDESLTFPFQLNQAIVNGTSFFDYTKTYVNMYRFLFENSGKNSDIDFFSSFYKDYCTRFKKKGDGYLLELYKSLIMLVFDKFGVLGLTKNYLLLYALVFRFRLEKRFVKYDSVAKLPLPFFNQIVYAKDILDLYFLKPLALETIHRQENNKNNDIVEDFFMNKFKVEIV